jgi:hypothetical protein
MDKIQEAFELIQNLKLKNRIQTNKAVSELIYPSSETKAKSFANEISKLRNKNTGIAEKSAIHIIKTIKIFYEPKQEKKLELPDFFNFLDKQIKEGTSEFYSEIEGLYLMFRKSNVDKENKIVVSYLQNEFKDNHLSFITERNNIEKEVHIKTIGVGVKNISNSYMFIGLSSSSDTSYSRSFIETFTIKKDNYETIPVIGYWSGFISLNLVDTPFVGTFVLVKIKDESSRKEILQETEIYNSEKKVSFYKKNKIITLHDKKALEDDHHPVNQILKNEKNESYDLTNILKNLEDEDLFYLRKYTKNKKDN